MVVALQYLQNFETTQWILKYELDSARQTLILDIWFLAYFGELRTPDNMQKINNKVTSFQLKRYYLSFRLIN